MWQQYTLKWLWLSLFLLISGCSGGGAFDTEAVDPGAAGGGTGDPIDTARNGTLSIIAPAIVPFGVADATIKVSVRDANSIPMADVPLIVSAISDIGVASVNNSAPRTDGAGNAEILVSADQGAVNVTIGAGTTQDNLNLTGDTHFTIHFGVNIGETIVINNPQPATGDLPITVQVRVQNSRGVPLADIPATLKFESNSPAVMQSAPTGTDANGLFSVEVVSSVAGFTTVVPLIGNVQAQPVTLEFTATSSGNPQSPAMLDVIAVNNLALPDGTSPIELIAIARDAAGIPIKNVDITINSSSSTAVVDPLLGNTGEEAKLNFSVTNTVEESVFLTIRAGQGSGQITVTKGILFRSDQVSNTIGQISVEVSGNTPGTLANGTDAAVVTVTVRDSTNSPIEGVPVDFIKQISAIQLNPASGVTDAAGRFTTRVSSDQAIVVPLTPLINNVLYESHRVSLNFISASDSDSEPAELIVTVSNLDATVPADGLSAYNLFAVVRDKNRAPIRGVQVALSSSSPKAMLRFFEAPVATGSSFLSGLTGPNGSLAFQFSSTIPGGVELTAITPEYSSVIGAVETFIFTEPETTSANTPIDTVTLVSDVTSQTADGQAVVTLSVIARGANGVPISNLRVNLATASNTSGAIFAESTGTTGDNGVFSTTVTNTQREQVEVIATVFQPDNTAKQSNKLTLDFVPDASPGAIEPHSLRLEAFGSPALPDGQSPINLRVLALDVSGKMLPNTDVRLDVTVSGQQPGPLFKFDGGSAGITADNGAFDTALTSTTVGMLDIVAVSASGAVRSSPLTVEFTTDKLATLRLEVFGSPALPDGQSPINLRALAFDANNKALSDIDVVLEVTSVGQPGPLFVFAGNQNSGKTLGNGAFDTSITSTTAGDLDITAVSGSIRSSTEPVSFVADAAERPASLIVLASNPELPSHNPAEGVVISALAKTSANTPFAGQKINFSVTSGLIEPLLSDGATELGVTNPSGLARARLSTGGDPQNRAITVIAGVDGQDCNATTVSTNPLCAQVAVNVTGTKIGISGLTQTTVGKTNIYVVTSTDANDKPIANKGLELTLSGATNSSFVNVRTPQCTTNSNTRLNCTTDAQGRISVDVKFDIAGAETLSVTGLGVTTKADITVTDAQRTVTIEPFTANFSGNIKLNTTERFGVNINPEIPGGIITVSTTRGHITTTSACNFASPSSTQQINVDVLPNQTPNGFEYHASFYLCADNVGSALVTVETSDGIKESITVGFIPDQPDSLTLQASPASIGVNAVDSDTQQSEIIAIVRDINNNLVPEQTVIFSVNDVTAGSLTQASAVTDQFGRATTIFIAGNSPTASDGISITAEVLNKPNVAPKTVKVTVAKREAFIILGTGNNIEERDTTTYAFPYTALVTDVQGAPIGNTTLTLSAIPKYYYTGFRIPTVDPDGWATFQTYRCLNEDVNRNSILDANEDRNENGILDPRNVVTFDPATVTTDENGFANFKLLYPQQYAKYIEIEIEARTIVSGTESIAIESYELWGSAEDFSDPNQTPPGLESPYGLEPFIETEVAESNRPFRNNVGVISNSITYSDPAGDPVSNTQPPDSASVIPDNCRLLVKETDALYGLFK